MDELSRLVRHKLPSPLKGISYFLSDAKRMLRVVVDSHDGENVFTYQHMFVVLVNYAFKLLEVIQAVLDDDSISTIAMIEAARNIISKEFSHPVVNVRAVFTRGTPQVCGAAADILVTETNSICSLAQDYYLANMPIESSRNFNAACVYFRLLQSMIPERSKEIGERLRDAAVCLNQHTPYDWSFSTSHYGESRCPSVYDIKNGASLLGRGSYGSVYLGKHRVTGDSKAIKVLNVDRVTSYYLRKVHTEIDILRSVDHPCIVKLHEVFFGRRSVYMVTDQCTGGELFEYLTSSKRPKGFSFPEHAAAPIIRDMLSAVSYLHSKGIIHRDLKLENFLFSGPDSTRLVLIDFGLSKHVDPKEVLDQVVGSCYYTAPEVLQGKYTSACDLWSAGVICYMLLTGFPPFRGANADEIYSSILKDEVDYEGEKVKSLSNTVTHFIQNLLVKNPDYRMNAKQAMSHAYLSDALCTASAPLSSALSGNIERQTGPFSNSFRSPFSTNQDDTSARHHNLPHIASAVAGMKRFLAADVLMRLILHRLAYSLDYAEVLQIRDEFMILDQEGNGCLHMDTFSHWKHQQQHQDKFEHLLCSCLAAASQARSGSCTTAASMRPPQQLQDEPQGFETVGTEQDQRHSDWSIPEEGIQGLEISDGLHVPSTIPQRDTTGQAGTARTFGNHEMSSFRSSDTHGSSQSSHNTPVSSRSNVQLPTPDLWNGGQPSTVRSTDHVTYTEYIAMTMLGRVHVHPSRLLLVFQQLESNHSGYVTAKSIQDGTGCIVPLKELQQSMEHWNNTFEMEAGDSMSCGLSKQCFLTGCHASEIIGDKLGLPAHVNA